MVFEYTPTSDVLVESFWSFSIPSQGIVVPFLLVGHVTEPRVTLDRPAINFGRVSAIHRETWLKHGRAVSSGCPAIKARPLPGWSPTPYWLSHRPASSCWKVSSPISP